MDYYKVESHADVGSYILFTIYRYKNIDDLEDEQPPTQIIGVEVCVDGIKYTSKYAKPIVVSDDDQEIMFDAIKDYFMTTGRYPRQVIEYQNVLLKFNQFVSKK